MTVLPFLKCRCGQGGSRLEMTRYGLPGKVCIICEFCLRKAADTYARVMPIVRAMRDAGIAPDVAKLTMDFLLARILENP